VHAFALGRQRSHRSRWPDGRPVNIISDNVLTRKSGYGSIIVSVYGIGTVGGFSEKGFQPVEIGF
jgi:hypothetical protein